MSFFMLRKQNTNKVRMRKKNRRQYDWMINLFILCHIFDCHFDIFCHNTNRFSLILETYVSRMEFYN